MGYLVKVLLLDPPGQATTHRFFPLGLMYIQAYLKNNGYPETFLRRLKRSDRLVVYEHLDRLDPDVVGITCWTGNHQQTLYLAQMIKTYKPRIKLVLGGHHAMFMHQQILENYSFVDYIVRGEGEVSFKELVDHIKSGDVGRHIAGISGRDGQGRVWDGPERVPVADLDTLPFPCYDDVQDVRRTADSFLMLTSRGCPFACSYCADSAYYGHRRRQRSVGNIIAEMRYIKNMSGIKKLIFVDDFLTADIKHSHELFEQIVKERFGFDLDVQTRADHWDADLLLKMKNAGVSLLSFGLESGSKDILKGVNRSLAQDKIFAMVREAERIGLKTKAKIVIGWPKEDWRALFSTVQVLTDLAPYVFQVLCLSIMPGTALYEEIKKAGYASDKYWLDKSRHMSYFELKRGWFGKCLFHIGVLCLMAGFLWKTRSWHRFFESL